MSRSPRGRPCAICRAPIPAHRLLCLTCARPAAEGEEPTTEWGKARARRREELRELGAPPQVIRAAMRGSQVIHS